MGTQTQHLTRTESLCGFYSEIFGRSQISTQQKNIKRQSPSSLSAKSTSKRAQNLKEQLPQLVSLAIFFAMRSCKYLKVHQSELRRTEIVRLRDIRLFQGRGEQLDHDDPKMEYTNCVSITFERQKKDEKLDTTNQMALGESLLSCSICSSNPKKNKKIPRHFPELTHLISLQLWSHDTSHVRPRD